MVPSGLEVSNSTSPSKPTAFTTSSESSRMVSSLPVPNQHIQANKACANSYIICFKLHVSSIKIQTSGLSLSTNSAFTFSHATCGSYSTCGPRIISVSVKNSSSCNFPSIFSTNSLYVGRCDAVKPSQASASLRWSIVSLMGSAFTCTRSMSSAHSIP